MKHLAVALGFAGLAGAGLAYAAGDAKGRGCEGPPASAGEHRHGHGMQRMAAMHARMGAMHAERHGQGREHDHGAKQEDRKQEQKQ